ncbi:hypothetical protein AB0G32_15800 [Streptomyces sp. NPDC023723]|uniref:hypothetical protein n=1 Tax=Streptomyces sp. NPDC023723 TaxID=3154323 RepID=UPI0033F3943D
MTEKNATTPEAGISVPAEVYDRLAGAAAGAGLSLRAYLGRLAQSLPTPAPRAEPAERTRAVRHEWNGYDPSEEEQAELDVELDRRLARAGTRDLLAAGPAPASAASGPPG